MWLQRHTQPPIACRLKNRAFHNSTTQVPKDHPIGVFPPIRLGPVSAGLFVARTGKKRAGRMPCSNALLERLEPLLPALSFGITGRHVFRAGALLPRLGPRGLKGT